MLRKCKFRFLMFCQFTSTVNTVEFHAVDTDTLYFESVILLQVYRFLSWHLWLVRVKFLPTFVVPWTVSNRLLVLLRSLWVSHIFVLYPDIFRVLIYTHFRRLSSTAEISMFEAFMEVPLPKITSLQTDLTRRPKWRLMSAFKVTLSCCYFYKDQNSFMENWQPCCDVLIFLRSWRICRAFPRLMKVYRLVNRARAVEDQN